MEMIRDELKSAFLRLG